MRFASTHRHSAEPNTSSGPEGPRFVQALPAGTGERGNGSRDAGNEVALLISAAGHDAQY